MNILDINNKYKSELIKSIHTGKINDFRDIYFDQMHELITLLELINSDFIPCYLLLFQLMCLQIDLYNRYSFLIRMALLLGFR